MTSEVDVAIVGAGAAGLAAGKRLQMAGVSFRVLEARARSGGRAWTDTETFPGIAFDRGCHWLHSASINPLRAEADRLGVRYRKQFSWGERRIFRHGAWLSDTERDAYGKAFEEAYGAMYALGDAGRDVAVVEALRPDQPFLDEIRHVYTLISSAELEDVSAVDASRYNDTEENWPVESGYGALVQKVAAGVPVALATPVTSIDWLGKYVTVRTNKGDLHAKAVIVTASTNVLAGGGIRFDPALPGDVAAALESVPIGCAEKVALVFDGPVEDVPDNSFMTISIPGEASLNFYLKPFGQPIAHASLGGNSGRAIEKEGEAAMIAYSKERFVAAYGADLGNRIKAATATHWVSDPYIRGAYSYARPGKADMRKRLAKPFSDRLFLAGEATSEDFFSTAHGAHLSGMRAAERALKAIGVTV